MFPPEGNTLYTIRYRFGTATQSFESSARIEYRYWVRIKPGYRVPVRYLPDHPAANLPWNTGVTTDGWHIITFLSLIALFCLIILVALVVILLRGGFDTEKFPVAFQHTDK